MDEVYLEKFVRLPSSSYPLFFERNENKLTLLTFLANSWSIVSLFPGSVLIRGTGVEQLEDDLRLLLSKDGVELALVAAPVLTLARLCPEENCDREAISFIVIPDVSRFGCGYEKRGKEVWKSARNYWAQIVLKTHALAVVRQLVNSEFPKGMRNTSRYNIQFYI